MSGRAECGGTERARLADTSGRKGRGWAAPRLGALRGGLFLTHGPGATLCFALHSPLLALLPLASPMTGGGLKAASEDGTTKHTRRGAYRKECSGLTDDYEVVAMSNQARLALVLVNAYYVLSLIRPVNGLRERGDVRPTSVI